MKNVKELATLRVNIYFMKEIKKEFFIDII